MSIVWMQDLLSGPNTRQWDNIRAVSYLLPPLPPASDMLMCRVGDAWHWYLEKFALLTKPKPYNTFENSSMECNKTLSWTWTGYIIQFNAAGNQPKIIALVHVTEESFLLWCWYLTLGYQYHPLSTSTARVASHIFKFYITLLITQIVCASQLN